MKKVLIIVILFFCATQVLFAGKASILAQDRTPNAPTMPAAYHAEMTQIAVDDVLEKHSDLQQEIELYTWKSGDYEDRYAVVAGAHDEDKRDSWYPPDNRSVFPWLHHSWDPDTNGHWFDNELWNNFLITDYKGSAIDWADYYFREAVRIYPSDKPKSYYTLGRVAHLLGDMATPAHVHLDEHYFPGDSPDSYEDFLAKNPTLPAYDGSNYYLLDYTSLRAKNYIDLTNQVANYNITGGVDDSADELWGYGPISYSSRFFEANSKHRVDYDLFHIFYSMAETADNYNSNDGKGEASGPPFDLSDLSKVRDNLAPEGANHIAALLELFWDRTHADTHIDVILVIDSSGSMSWNDSSNKRLDAAKNFLTSSVAGDYVGIVDFDYSARLASSLIEIEANRQTLIDAINSIDSSGGTNIAAGVQMACDELKQSTSNNGTKAAILLTDGEGTFNSEDVCFSDQGWPIYTFALGSANDDLLRQIAQNTGGEFSRLDTSTLLCEFQAIRTKIANGVPTNCESTHMYLAELWQFSASVSPAQLQQTFSTSWLGSDFVMSLTSPSGRVINRSTVANDVFHDLDPTYESYRIDKPEAGEWLVSILADDVPPEGEEVVFSLSSIPLPLNTPGSITMSVSTNPPSNDEFEFEGDLGTFKILSGITHVVDELLSGNYLITQKPANGWMLTNIDCKTADIEEQMNGVIVRLRPGEEASCTFENEPAPLLEIYLPVIAKR